MALVTFFFLLHSFEKSFAWIIMQSRGREAEKRQQSIQSLEMDQFGIFVNLKMMSRNRFNIMYSNYTKHCRFRFTAREPFIIFHCLSLSISPSVVYWFHCVVKFKFGARISMSKMSWNGTTVAPKLEPYIQTHSNDSDLELRKSG